MKTTYLLIGLGLVMIIASIFNLSLNVDNKGHYFGNGVACGVGLSVIVVQLLKLRRVKRAV